MIWLDQEHGSHARAGSGRLAAGAAAALALCLRRERPAAVLGATVLIVAVTDLALPSSAGAPVLWAAEFMALYSLAVHRRARTAVTGGALAVAVASVVAAVMAGGGAQSVPVEARRQGRAGGTALNVRRPLRVQTCGRPRCTASTRAVQMGERSFLPVHREGRSGR
ncbi:hypothetical protein ETD83_38915 [Actinomadura soli]|uniref:Uncharacterized protein n=2 Tax=Actinomadura soli TaxID=2508997 RepID=A0A5C4J0D4_9ACTN|nr:hypothetical protein ETD83_38915 [Actinomadura soli]